MTYMTSGIARTTTRTRNERQKGKTDAKKMEANKNQHIGWVSGHAWYISETTIMTVFSIL